MSAECGLLSHRLQAKLAVTTGENMKLNEKLVSLRKAQKLNQAQAAEALNVSRQAISTWETGAVLPSTDSLKALSRLYQVPVDHLLREEMDMAFIKILGTLLGFMFPVFFIRAIEESLKENDGEQKYIVISSICCGVIVLIIMGLLPNT